MEAAYYYSGGRRVPVARLETARVLLLPEDREDITVPGWQTISIGVRHFALLMPADASTERRQPQNLENLVDNLLIAEETSTERSVPELNRALREELNTPSFPAYIGEGKSLLLPTGEVVAKFNANLQNPDQISSEISRLGGKVIEKINFLPDTYLLQAGGDSLDFANALVEANLVEFAHPNFIEEMPWRQVASPSNDLFPNQWHLHNTGQNGSRVGADVQSLLAWEITTGSPSITICILDSGLDSGHEAFSEPGKVISGFDFDDDDAFPDPTTSSHGTSCAGVAAAPWGVGRVVGIAPDCRIMPIRRATLSEHTKLAQAFAWAADNGADVISCSFGHDGRPWVLPDIVRAALDYAVGTGRGSKGCVIIWAAGNGSEIVSTDEFASNDRVIAVAASTDQDTRAVYSDYGPEVDLCAPSSGGINGITTTANGGYTSQFGGTSSAAPLVAGIAALVLSVNPNLTWREVHQILRQGTDRIDVANGQYDQSGHSPLYGYGRANAFKALHAISPLDEIARGESDLQSLLPSIRRFATEYLSRRVAGQTILMFLEQRKFQLIRLTNSSQEFRHDTVLTLKTLAHLIAALEAGQQVEIPEETWAAVTRIARRLLTVQDELDGERDVDYPGGQPILYHSSFETSRASYTTCDDNREEIAMNKERSTRKERSTDARTTDESERDTTYQALSDLAGTFTSQQDDRGERNTRRERSADTAPSDKNERDTAYQALSGWADTFAGRRSEGTSTRSQRSQTVPSPSLEEVVASTLRAVDARNSQAGEERISALSLPWITVGIILHTPPTQQGQPIRDAEGSGDSREENER